MTDHEICRASARAKAQAKHKKIILERDADVPHDCIIEEEDSLTQWMNRYSGESLRWPLFDCTSLLSWVWGLPMVVPNEELGICFNMFKFSFVCFDVAGICLSVDQEPRRPHYNSFDFIVCFRASSSLLLLTGSIRHLACIDLT